MNFLPHTLKDCLWSCVAMALLALLAGGVMVGVEYGLPIAHNLRTASANASDTTGDLHQMTASLKPKVAALDLKASLANVQTATSNLAKITADISAITGDVRGRLPKINLYAWMLWRHGDKVLDHLDTATKDSAKEQKEIAENTSKTLAATAKTAQDVDAILPAISHIATNFQSMSDDGAAVTAHYKKIITTPKRWYIQMRDDIVGFGAKVFGAWL